MWSSTRNVYTSNINMKCVKNLRGIHVAPTSRLHVHNAVLGDTPDNLEAFFDDLMCWCAWRDYPDHITRKVCDYVAPYGLWNFHILYPIINSQVRDRSRAIPPSNALKGANFVSWLGSLDGGFKVSKAYLGLFYFNALNIDPLFDNIWKLKVPKRFQILSWKFRVNSLPHL